MTDRLEKLRSQYPEVTQSALMNMPAGLEADAVKVHSFAEAWETAEALGNMLKKHVLGLGRPGIQRVRRNHRANHQRAGALSLRNVPE